MTPLLQRAALGLTMSMNNPAPAPGREKSPPLAGKVAVVTGGSNGIGAATVRLLANEGASVVVGFNKGAGCRSSSSSVWASFSAAFLTSQIFSRLGMTIW
jgi:hypothetical protein